MSLNAVPSGERTHIAFFGCRNAGKSSLVNAFCGQQVSIVSEVRGTTTDPVQKSMELLPLGPVVIIDTPGIDDEGSLGEQRVQRTRDILRKTDIAVLVSDATRGLNEADLELIGLFDENAIPHIVAYNKADLIPSAKDAAPAKSESILSINTSALTGYNIRELKEMVAHLMPDSTDENTIIGDLISPGDTLILVIPIDKAAPKGRLILPQQQVIRDALDHGAMPLVCRDSELEVALGSLNTPPKLVITDSQVFGKVSKIVPESIPLTSFSILMARYKGTLLPSVEGAAAIDNIRDGERILISEGCTHHRQCGDIGSVKLPALIKKYTGKEVEIILSSGAEFPRNLSEIGLVIHCGGCMLNPAEVKARYKIAETFGTPITNYGIAISYMNGILKRSISMLPEVNGII